MKNLEIKITLPAREGQDVVAILHEIAEVLE